jgi:hypothetical protein
MDSMIEVGVSTGGVLNGEYIWAKVGSEMKIVRVGSNLHNALIISTDDRKLKKISRNSLTPGKIYKGKGGNQYLFIGYVDVTDLEVSVKKAQYLQPTTTGTRNELKNRIMVTRLYDFVKKEFDTFTWFEIKDSHTFIKEVGSLEIPENAIDIIRIKSQKKLMEDILTNTKPSFSGSGTFYDRGWHYHPEAFARKSGEDIQYPEDVMNILDRYYPVSVGS